MSDMTASWTGSLWHWPHQPLHSQCNLMSCFQSEKPTKKWSLSLQTVSTALPAARCYSTGCFDKTECGETWGCKAGLCFHISTIGIKSARCRKAHYGGKKKKKTCLSNLCNSNHQLSKKWWRGNREDWQQTQDVALWDSEPHLSCQVCLYEADFTWDSKYGAKVASWHTQTSQKKKRKKKTQRVKCNVEDTQWLKIQLKPGHLRQWRVVSYSALRQQRQEGRISPLLSDCVCVFIMSVCV